jgi:hypothetical protein
VVGDHGLGQGAHLGVLRPLQRQFAGLDLEKVGDGRLRDEVGCLVILDRARTGGARRPAAAMDARLLRISMDFPLILAVRRKIGRGI